jgi:hypothetical protein
VCGEGGGGIHRRMAAWHSHYGIEPPEGFLVVPYTFGLTQDTEAAVLADIIKEGLGGANPSMIYLDTLARMLDGDENSTRDMGVYINTCTKLSRICGGAAITSIHHTGKDWTKGARGSIALKGACDAEISVTGTAQTVIDVRCEKIKEGEPFKPYCLEAHKVAGSLVLLAEPAERNKLRHLGDEHKGLLAILTTTFKSAPFSYSDGMKVQTAKTSTYRSRLQALVEKQFITKLADGSYVVNNPSRGWMNELEAELNRLGQRPE